jgi:hypothetical protein
LGARAFVVEDHYIDRHFIEEFSAYYARALAPPPNYCRRIHLLKEAISDPDLSGFLVDASRSRESKLGVEKRLTGSYLGYVVVRPLPQVPIGRTILRPLEDNPQREILATTTNNVHFLGLRLSVRGLAFQQQDRAVGACATAALWMAMAAKLDGRRAPTPAHIAEVAARNSVALGRSLPSRGLEVSQIATAIRECGFAPEVLNVTQKPENFVASIYPYLRSGIPVLLVLADNDGAHAVTVVGYRLGNTRPELEFILPLRSTRLERLYVHDDRLGPYARATLHTLIPEEAPAEENEAAKGALFLKIEETEGPVPVVLALVPVYPKLRVSSEHFWLMATRFATYMEETIGHDAFCEVFFVRSGSYLDELVALGDAYPQAVSLPGARLARFLKTISMSRWICIVRWWSPDERPMADLLFDTTDVVREANSADGLLLGAVALAPEMRPHLDVVGQSHLVPIL